MNKNIIFQQKQERDNLLQQNYIHRIADELLTGYLSTTLIKLITGPRRSGKSVIALQLLQNKQFAYLNFDDDLLLKNFDENLVMQYLHEVYNEFEYLLLDEIQNLPDWEMWVNKLYRRGLNMVITGSNAKLLSREMATSLTGRYIQIKVLPFGFDEYLLFRDKIAVSAASEIENPINNGNKLYLLNEYLQNGGFPEVVLNPNILRNYLSTLFDSILLKDIMKRFRIRQTQQLYDLSNYLLTNFTNLFTYNQLTTDLNAGSVTTIQKFVDFLEEPYLFQHLARYSTKVKTQQKAAQKMYIIDNGFIKAKSFELSPNYGRLLENLVFIELLRRNYQPDLDLFYFRTKNDREIDFLLRKGHQVEQLIQVCYDISAHKTLKRELNALAEAAKELNCKNLLLITWSQADEIIEGETKIIILPVLDWLQQSTTLNMSQL